MFQELLVLLDGVLLLANTSLRERIFKLSEILRAIFKTIGSLIFAILEILYHETLQMLCISCTPKLVVKLLPAHQWF